MKYSDLFFIDEVRHALRRGYAYCFEGFIVSMIHAGIKEGWLCNNRFSVFSVSGRQRCKLQGRSSILFPLYALRLDSAELSELLHFFGNSHAAA